MRAVIQCVSSASVTIGDRLKGAIRQGLLILLGIEVADTLDDASWLCRKIVQIRIFNDAEGIMNRSVIDVRGGMLVVSQFTLHASTRKGNRPSYIRAARPEQAIPLYEAVIRMLRDLGGTDVQSGEFGANMQVTLTNDGPVTLVIDTKSKE